MNWQEYKKHMREEWEFRKRNPDFFVVEVLFLAVTVWCFISD